MTTALSKIAKSVLSGIKIACDESLLAHHILRKFTLGTFETRSRYDALDRPHYAYGLLRAAHEAKARGLNRFTAIEFGVAGGNGLVALEQHANSIKHELNIGVDIVGFDLGEGLSAPVDYRDLPYYWRSGYYKMEFSKLKERLTGAEVILGDVQTTLVGFLARQSISPIGFVAFDVDYYSSTRSAFGIFSGNARTLMPRVFCYFDDIIGDDYAQHGDGVGQLLAIREYNENHKSSRISQINGLRHKRKLPHAWNDMMYVHHQFDSPSYCTYIHPDTSMQLPLK